MTTPDPHAQQPNVEPMNDDVPVPPVSDAAPAAADDAPGHESQALAEAQHAVTKIEHTASRATVFGWVVGIVVTILLLVFILRNQGSQSIDLVFGTVNLPVGVSLLIAAIAGAIITLAITGVRIVQLRRALTQVDKSARRPARRKK